MKVVNTHLGLFDYTIRVIIGDYQEGLKYVHRLYGDDIYDSTVDGYVPRGQCHHKPGYVPIVWIPSYPKTPREYATLSHEIIHAALHVFDWAGMSVNEHTEEVLCHTVGHVVTNVLEKAAKVRTTTKPVKGGTE